MNDYTNAAQERLAQIRTAMPKAKWSIKIEQKIGSGQYQTMDVETGLRQ
jgi:hypothetical protein